MTELKHKPGDYVLVHRLMRVHWASLPPTLPAWAHVVHRYIDDEFTYSTTIMGDDIEARRWGVDDDDIVPEAEITPEQWAELARWRLSQ